MNPTTHLPDEESTYGHDCELSRDEISELFLDRYVEPTKARKYNSRPQKSATRSKKRANSAEVSTSSHSRSNDHSPFTLIDLFAGCGGLSLGLEQSHFRPLLFSEINENAADTYLANRPGLEIIPVADIYSLTDTDLKLLKSYWHYKGINDIDLVCGGPPCQGYSGIGHRRTFKLEKKDIPSNLLFQEMVRVIRRIRPKMFLFENVRGLLNSRWSADGSKGEIFQAVLEEFATLDEYRIRWDVLYAKDYGVPQNRPRIIMLGIRSDVIPTHLMYAAGGSSIPRPEAVIDGFLPKPDGTPPDLVDLLSDLEDSSYLSKGTTTEYPKEASTEIQRMLRTTKSGQILIKGESLTEHEYSAHASDIREKFLYMIQNNGVIPEKFRTKKFAQRVLPMRWGVSGPNVTVTSLPEDYVHYRQPRALTVREWARMQMFPDWYVFKGPRTTGGRRRAGDPDQGIWEREVPRYTQIGNAVPVLLAEKIGRHLVDILTA